jgi:acetate kinase
VKNLLLDFHGQIKNIFDAPELQIKDKNGVEVFYQKDFGIGYDNAIKPLLSWIKSNLKNAQLIGAGHRVVHGGREFIEPVIVSEDILIRLKKLIPLAPLHQPCSIKIIEAFAKLYPNISQIACFDTSFHHTQIDLERLFALPNSYSEEGVISYGFHGLSYQYIASVLPKYAGKDGSKGRVIIAHLGNGASICALSNLKSVATTMSFTALDGLVMGTRPGNIDPGVILYLMEEKNMSAKEISTLLYQQSGLKGVSDISHDMHILLKSSEDKAKKAIELFCYKAAKQLSGLIPTIGGLDILVFTAGIGENSPVIRKKICDYLSWLGMDIEPELNNTNQSKISSNNSKIEVYVIGTNEEKVIAQQTYQQLK